MVLAKSLDVGNEKSRCYWISNLTEQEQQGRNAPVPLGPKSTGSQ